MGSLHYKEKLSDFVDQQLSAEERQIVGEHLLVCDDCRREHDSIRIAAGLAGTLGRSEAPESVWRSIESELDGTAPHVTIIPSRRPFGFRMAAAFGMAILLVGLFSVLAYRGLWTADDQPLVRHSGPADIRAPHAAPTADGPTLPNGTDPIEPTVQPDVPSSVNTIPDTSENSQPPAEYWKVETLAGEPQTASGEGKLAVGSYLVTDGASRARVEVADIGTVDIQPNSRVKLVGTTAKQHRLSLERGALHARIAAPPRLFIVDTPSAMAVDLGCEYTLEVDAAGNNRLHVTSGFVALERGGRESIVPAGAMCLTRKGKGLGTPFSADTTDGFRRALERFDFGGGGSAAVAELIATKNHFDIISLWHMISRVSRVDREKVFDALAGYVPPPEGVTREGVLKLNKAMLERWRDEVETVWFE